MKNNYELDYRDYAEEVLNELANRNTNFSISFALKKMDKKIKVAAEKNKVSYEKHHDNAQTYLRSYVSLALKGEAGFDKEINRVKRGVYSIKGD